MRTIRFGTKISEKLEVFIVKVQVDDNITSRETFFRIHNYCSCYYDEITIA